MFGLDDSIAAMTDGTSLLLVVVVAVLLGLRHATDPDHLAAVTTLVASGRRRAAGQAARLGVAWGVGHALTLFAFGLPIVLFEAYLPAPVQQGAETAVGVLIVCLAVWLLVRWRRGLFHVHEHEHDGVEHAHVHGHAEASRHGHPHRGRTPLGALAVGLMHGMGGSAGVGVLLVATIESRAYAVAALAILAVFTAVSMTVLTTGFGLGLGSLRMVRAYGRVAPALGCLSLAFGVWYALGALELAPYAF
jgi:ABC-type nickel/cobalt efflux system permease component RcnA